jgi:hypothetical protein
MVLVNVWTISKNHPTLKMQWVSAPVNINIIHKQMKEFTNCVMLERKGAYLMVIKNAEGPAGFINFKELNDKGLSLVAKRIETAIGSANGKLKTFKTKFPTEIKLENGYYSPTDEQIAQIEIA